MKWVVIGLFLAGVLLQILAKIGKRADERDGQSADVAMENDFVAASGFALWGLDVAILVVWGLWRLMFT